MTSPIESPETGLMHEIQGRLHKDHPLWRGTVLQTAKAKAVSREIDRNLTEGGLDWIVDYDYGINSEETIDLFIWASISSVLDQPRRRILTP